jgi:hypothetical protein
MGPSKRRWNGDRRQPFDTAMKAKQRSTAQARRVPQSCDIGRPLDSRPKLCSPSPGRLPSHDRKHDVKVPKMYFKSAIRARSTSREFTESA